jgi:predicted ATP-binding protein involved in virulence
MLKLERLVIKKLFGTFDYTIDLKPEDLTVLIGPNGYGKTTILRILYELSQRNFLYFIGLNFQKIEILLNNKQSIIIEKQNDTELSVVVSDKRYTIDCKKILERFFNEVPFFHKSDNINQLIDLKTGSKITIQNAITDLINNGEHKSNLVRLSKRLLNNIPKFQFPNVYLIREQRLLKKIDHTEELFPTLQSKSKNSFEETIIQYAKLLKEIIAQTDSKYAEKSRELDSSYPRRLFESKKEIQENEFRARFDKIKETQESLRKYGISITYEQKQPEFDPANAKALCVYINDVEEKLHIFEQLLKTLNLFLNILYSREFPHKNINISKEYGLKFVTDNGNSLELSDLSSGEQHEVVLLFDLLFQADSNTLVLIDEPEISLHIVWQKAFLADILKIIELRKISVLVATHSPQIVNDNWDNVVDLGGDIT